MKQAERAIAQEQYGEAIDQLGSLLHAPPVSTGADQVPAQEDFFLGRAGEPHYQTSLRSQALRLLGSLPASGRELYELQFGAEARRSLEQALASSDLDGLADLSRKYFHTDAGYKATFLLGRLYLDRGRPLAAAMCFQRLRDTRTAWQRYDPELSVLLGVSWQMAARPDRALAVLEDLRQRNPKTEVLVRGERLPIFADEADAGSWLAKAFDPSERSPSRILGEWRMHRGDPPRNATVDGGLPLLRPRWRVPVSNDPDDEELVQSLMVSHQENEWQPLPSCFPLLVDGVALLRTSDNLLAVDSASGKRIWEFPWSGPLNIDTDQETLVYRQNELRRQQLEERLWRDAVYGQLSSDGRSVFLVDDLGYTLQAAFGRRVQIFRGMRVENPNQPKDFNALVALDIATQGKYRWRVGGVTGEDEPALAGAFFLGPPLVLAEDLYVLAEIRGDISLFVLDSQTGHLRWSQQLAHVGQSNILVDSVRRLAGAAPSYSDGVLICPTSSGAVVAVDLANRSLLWGFEYPRTIVQPVYGAIALNRLRAGQSAGELDPWADATVTLADGSRNPHPGGDEHRLLPRSADRKAPLATAAADGGAVRSRRRRRQIGRGRPAGDPRPEAVGWGNRLDVSLANRSHFQRFHSRPQRSRVLIGRLLLPADDQPTPSDRSARRPTRSERAVPRTAGKLGLLR